VIVEAIIEQLPAKQELFRCWMRFVRRRRFLRATRLPDDHGNCGGDEAAAAVCRLALFQSVPVMKLVEVVRTIATEPAVYEEMVAFGAKLGKTPVRAQDSTGFIVNRLLVPYLLDAIRALEEGVGSIEDIDIR